MPVTMVLVGTRKGCFVLESDADRRTWTTRGPYCEGWPVYHAVHDADSGSIYAAAASEWHGAGVWRSADLGETWELSSEGLGYGEDSELRLSKVSGLTRRRTAACSRAARAAACSRAATGPGRGRCSARSTTSRAATPGTSRPTSRPGTSACPGLLPHPDEADRFWAVIQGFGIFETTDNGGSWTPRNRGLRADWPLENPEVGYCVHKLVMSPHRHRPALPAEPRRHAPQRRRRAVLGRDHATACRPSSGSPPPRTRTTATAST